MSESKYRKIEVTRRKAARCQIETAIDLVFGHQAPVSAHTLSWAAIEMMRGVAKAKNAETFHARLETRIKPEFLRLWRAHLKQNYNFAKHADRDPDKTIDDFCSETTTWTLFGACYDYSTIYGQRTWSMLVFQQWFFCRNPHIAEQPLADAIPKMAANLDNPADKEFENSTTAAAEVLAEGRKDFDMMERMLGEKWDGALEK